MYIFQKHRAEKPHTGIPFPLHLHAAFGKSLISLCLSIHPNIKCLSTLLSTTELSLEQGTAKCQTLCQSIL